MDSDEEFIDNSLAVGDIVYDEAQIAQQQQEYAAQLKLASTAIPTVVKDFIQYFHRCLSDNSVYELHGCYENSFGKLTDKFYKNSHWPHPVAQVAPLVKNDPVFLYFYSELYYRHLYAKLTPTPLERFESYSNYCNLFNYILNSDGPVDLELPTSWAWGIVDEFIYQYNSYWMTKEAHNSDGVAPTPGAPTPCSTCCTRCLRRPRFENSCEPSRLVLIPWMWLDPMAPDLCTRCWATSVSLVCCECTPFWETSLWLSRPWSPLS